MAADTAAVADARWSKLLVRRGWWRRAGQTCEDGLTEWTKRFGARVKLVWQSFACVRFQAHLGGDVVLRGL